MNILSIISLSVAILIWAAIPGPGVFATVASSLSLGFKQTLGIILGIVAGDIVYLMFAIFGLSIIAHAMGEFFVIVRLCGGVYLFYLGLKLWFSKPSAIGSEGQNYKHSRIKNVINGLIVTLSNPKVIIFYCGFLPTFIDLKSLSVMDIALIIGIVAFVLGAVLITYAFLVSQARSLLFNNLAMKRLHRAAGVMMMATGVTVATKS